MLIKLEDTSLKTKTEDREGRQQRASVARVPGLASVVEVEAG